MNSGRGMWSVKTPTTRASVCYRRYAGHHCYYWRVSPPASKEGRSQGRLRQAPGGRMSYFNSIDEDTYRGSTSPRCVSSRNVLQPEYPVTIRFFYRSLTSCAYYIRHWYENVTNSAKRTIYPSSTAICQIRFLYTDR